MCNWAKFVNGLIHEELAVKKKVGKVNTLLCGHYLSLVIQYCMKASKVNPKKTRLANVPGSSRQKTIALEDCLVHLSLKELVVQQGTRVEALKGENQGGSNWSERFVGLLKQLHVLSHEVKGIDKLKLELKDSKIELERVTTLAKHWGVKPKISRFFEWEYCQVDKKKKSYGKGECCTYDFVASQPTKREGKKGPPTKQNGRFGSSIDGVAKGENRGFECSCCGKAW